MADVDFWSPAAKQRDLHIGAANAGKSSLFCHHSAHDCQVDLHAQAPMVGLLWLDGQAQVEICRILKGLEEYVADTCFQDWLFLFGTVTIVLAETLLVGDKVDCVVNTSLYCMYIIVF
jgi:hypothetical protein